jgi:hypothetical protein
MWAATASQAGAKTKDDGIRLVRDGSCQPRRLAGRAERQAGRGAHVS